MVFTLPGTRESGQVVPDGASAEKFLLRILFDSSCEQPDQLAVDPDLDGRVVQNLPVTVPGTIGHGAAARGVVTANVPKPLLSPLAQVTVIVLHMLRHKLEFLDAINFHKCKVKLVVLVGVPDEESQEVEPGAFPDEDEVGRPVSQVGGWREAPGAPGTSTGHVCGVDGQEFPTDDFPLLHLLRAL